MIRPRHRSEPASPLLDALERRRADLRRLLEARTGDAAEAEDLLQDLFLKLQAAPSPDRVSDPEAFCFRLAYNLASDRRRADGRRRRREARWGVETASFVGLAAVPSEPAAEEVLAGRQQLAAVLAAVERLPARAQEAFRLHKLDGLSYAETARRLGVSVSAVEKHMMRAVAALSLAVDR